MIALPMRQSELSYYACGCNPADIDKTRVEQALPSHVIYLNDGVRH